MAEARHTGATEPDERPFGLAVRAVIRDEKGRVLLLRRSGSNKTNTAVWEFPGGKTEPGENFVDALVREVKEECGLDVVPTRAVGAVQTEHPGVRVVHLIMETEFAGGTVELSQEHELYSWTHACDMGGVAMLSPFQAFVKEYCFRSSGDSETGGTNAE